MCCDEQKIVKRAYPVSSNVKSQLNNVYSATLLYYYYHLCKLPISLCLFNCCQGQQPKSNYDSSIYYLDKEAGFLLDYIKVFDGLRLFMVQISILIWLVGGLFFF